MIFLSYRRADSPDSVARLHQLLKSRLRNQELFYDHKSLELGVDFPQALHDRVTSARVVLVCMGRHWLDELRNRPADKIDFVREEIRLALNSTALVIPVLLDGAKMPSNEELADFPELQLLGAQNAQAIRPDPDFEHDAEQLLAFLERTGPAEILGTIVNNKYKVLRLLSDQGGMGDVYLAEQTKPERRDVALKVVKPGMDSREILARFESERQALALLDHPNICKVFDGGMTATGRSFFAMEYVRGIPITHYCDQQKLTPAERIGLFLDVCHAVQHAHQKGIVHRDLKPGNVLVAVENNKPVVKVIDFGLAKSLGGKLTERSFAGTQLNTWVGTPEYASPEQVEGRYDIDTLTDVYSLGALLYELLAGSPPFSREELLRTGEEAMKRMIRETTPSTPSMKLRSSANLPTIAANCRLEPTKLTNSVAGDLDWILLKSLEKDRTHRYATPTALADDLQRHLNNEPISVGRPTRWRRFVKFYRRNRGQVLAGAAILLLLITGIAGTTWGYLAAKKAQETAESAQQEAERHEKLALAAAIKERTAKEQEQLAKEEVTRKAKQAEIAEKRATEEATSAQLLAHYINAQFMLSQGRIGPAFDAIRAAINIRPRWEYGRLLAEIVNASRENWRPVAHFNIDIKATVSAAFVGPEYQQIAVVNETRLHLFDVPTSKLLSENDLGVETCQPIRIGDKYIGVVHSANVKIFSKDDMSKPRLLTLKGGIKLALSDLNGKVLAVMLENGETTIFDVENFEPLAMQQFSLPPPAAGFQGKPSLSFSPSGKQLLFSPGIGNYKSTIWNWKTASKLSKRYNYFSDTLHFLDEQTLVCSHRWGSAQELFRMGLIDLSNLSDQKDGIVFESRASSKPISWRSFRTDGSSKILCAANSADSLDLFSLTDRTIISSTRFSSLIPNSAVTPHFLAFSPESNLIAITCDHGVTIFQQCAIPPEDALTKSVNISFWSMAASNEYQFTGYHNGDLANRTLKLVRQPFNEKQTVTIFCYWPEAKPDASADLWGLSATPDGNTVAAVWQENSGYGNVVSKYFRKAILIYRLNSKPDSQGRLSPERTIWLEKYQDIEGRNNRLVVLAPDGKTVTFVAANGDATIYRIDDGTVIAELQVGPTMRSSPDGSLIIGGSFRENKPVNIWKSDTGEKIFSTSASGKVRTFAITYDNRKLYVGWETDHLECFDLATGKSVSKIPSKVSPIAIAPNTDRFIGFLPDSNTNGSTVLGSLIDGQTIQLLNSGAHILNNAIFSPNGDCISFTKSRDLVITVSAISLEQSIKILGQTTPFVGTPPAIKYYRLNNQLQSFINAGETAAVLNILPKWLDCARITLADKKLEFANALSLMGGNLLQAKSFSEAETLLRENLTIRERTEPDAWTMFHAQVQHGRAKTGLKQFDEAAPLLMAGYAGMKERRATMTNADLSCLQDAVEALIENSKAQDNPDDVKKWEAERETLAAEIKALAEKAEAPAVEQKPADEKTTTSEPEPPGDAK